MIISITGLSGSGKTYLAENLSNYFDAEVISFDKISHSLMSNQDILNNLKAHFGDKIFENNFINRKKLGNIVFNNENELTFLNNLFQTKMEEIIDKQLIQNKNFILEYALLPKMKYFNQSNCKILIKASTNLRKIRIINRDNINEAYFLAREKNSLTYNESDYDIIIENDKNLDFENIANKIKEFI